MKKIAIAIGGFVVLSCGNHAPELPLPLINIANARHETVPMSRLFESVEYIRLETSAECLIDGKYTSFWVTDKYIISSDPVSSEMAVHLFDRATGRFIKRIASRGRGPGEYLQTTYCSLDEDNLVFYFDRDDDWMGVDIETGERTFVRKPQNMKRSVNGSFAYQPFGPLFPLKDGNFMSPVTNITGTDSLRLAVFDNTGTIVRTYPNYNRFIPEPGYKSKRTMNANIYYRDEMLYFHQLYDDTVHMVTPDGLKPHMIFNTDGNSIPYDSSRAKHGKKYYWVSLTADTDNYAFFDYYHGPVGGDNRKYVGYYDKKDNMTYVCSTPSENSSSTVYDNDIDGLFDLASFATNSTGEVYYQTPALRVIDFMERSTQTGAAADNLRMVKEDDNPVIVIAKLKK